MGGSVLIPGYDLVRCNIEECEWTDWAWGGVEIVATATGIGYIARTVVKGAAKGAKAGVTTVRHYSDAAGKEATTASDNLRAGKFVTRPGEISSRAGHLQIEEALEIQPGRGSNCIDLEVPNSQLRVSGDGSMTSGGAWQRQLTDEVSIDPDEWRRPPGRPRKSMTGC